MSFRKKLSFNIIIQSIGPLLSFLTTFLIARIGGAEIQGHFASITAWINLFVVIGTFGFPQSFVYLINKLKVSPNLLFKRSIQYNLLFFLFLFPALSLLYYINAFEKSIIGNYYQILIIIFPITILVLHGILRGIYLTFNQGVPFALFSIFPSIALFTFISLGLLNHYFDFIKIYLLSSIPTLIFVLIAVSSTLKKVVHADYLYKIPWIDLFEHGTNVFLQALFFALQPIIAYWVINNFIGGASEIGFMNMGIFILQGFLVPISMIAPLLFEYWTKNNNQNYIIRFTKIKFFILEGFIGIFIVILVHYFFPIIFGSEYLSAVPIVQIMIFFIPIIIHTRLLIPAIHSLGYPKFNTYTGIFRLLAFIITTGTWLIFSRELIGLAISWTLSELISSIFTIIHYRRIINFSCK